MLRQPGQPRPRLRCAGVAGATTGLAVAAGWLLIGQLDGAVRTADQALVRVCVVALLACVVWVWTAACSVVVEAWQGIDPALVTGPVPDARVVRRAMLAACGVALAGSIAAPGNASDGSLGGLPMPERALGPAHVGPLMPPSPSGPAAETVTVRPGDSLWLITARALPVGVSDTTISAGWHRLYRINRAVIGPDPDLIHPGQVLRLPAVVPNPTAATS